MGHTVLNFQEKHVLYRARLRVTLALPSTSHTIKPVSRVVEANIAVPLRQAAEFEARLLGRARTPGLAKGVTGLAGPVSPGPLIPALPGAGVPALPVPAVPASQVIGLLCPWSILAIPVDSGPAPARADPDDGAQPCAPAC